MRRKSLVLLALGAMAGLCGCEAQTLDPFLYKRTRVDHYDFKAEGKSAADTVEPERIEPLEIKESDAITLGAVYVHANQSPPLGYVVYFHGQCCNLNEHIDRAKMLSNVGYDVLAFDYRGWGTSTDVEPDEPGILEDSKAALAYFVQRTGVPRERLTYYGRSFGCAVATQLAVSESPAVLVLESAFASIEDFKTDSTRLDFPASYVSDSEWDNVARIEHVPSAVLLFHGTAVDFVRPEFSEKIYAHAHDPKKLVLVEGADHDTIPALMGDEWGKTLREWIREHTPPVE
ncbi:MAG: alpha/beta hydrolase [Myxococcaceae bacterium]|nr:alpha/beta hydrolase [Myxococcaceae bacterium]